MNLFLTLDDVNLKGQNVLLRLDLSMPFEGDRVRDTSRLDASLKTLKKLHNDGARTVIVTHIGRPKGMDSSLSTQKILPLLEEKLNAFIDFCPDIKDLSGAVKNLKDGDFILLENIRFYEGEEKDEENFSKTLAAPFDIYVNDAFSVSHRSHASVHGVTSFIPTKLAGYYFLEEVHALSTLFDPSKKPLVALVGGAKVSTKIPLLEHLLTQCDFVIVGGAMANTFLRANGTLPEGKSLVEEDYLNFARTLLHRHFHKLILPRDGVCTDSLENSTHILKVDIVNVPKTYAVVDMGTKSLAHIKEICKGAKTILWNGPVGVFEIPPFDEGSKAIASMLVDLTQKGVTTIAGGGDTMAALGSQKSGLSYASTSGGAFLAWLEGADLPGIKALERHIKVF